MAEDADDGLRTRYLDWCSARIASWIGEMSAAEAWELSRGGSDPVRALTLALTRRLPTLEQWLALMESDPEAVERDLIGFTGPRDGNPGGDSSRS